MCTYTWGGGGACLVEMLHSVSPTRLCIGWAHAGRLAIRLHSCVWLVSCVLLQSSAACCSCTCGQVQVLQTLPPCGSSLTVCGAGSAGCALLSLFYSLLSGTVVVVLLLWMRGAVLQEALIERPADWLHGCGRSCHILCSQASCISNTIRLSFVG